MRLQHALTPSRSSDALLAMRWMAILHGRVECSLGATGGVYTDEDAIKLLLAGTDVVHLCHVLLKEGPDALTRISQGVSRWMEHQGFEQLSEFRGRLSQISVLDPSEYERLNYIRVLDNYSSPDGVWR
jgi:dihydroorotate dehydrogenase (fumarate)